MKKFGVREICDVVLRAKAKQVIGDKTFFKGEPVCYFDTLKTSSLEGAATTVYAQGGRGNSRLIAWEGERTLTFTMEDALISPEGFMILSGAGLTEASSSNKIYVHTTQTLKINTEDPSDTTKDWAKKTPASGSTTGVTVTIHDTLAESTTDDPCVYAFAMEDGVIVSEPYECSTSTASGVTTVTVVADSKEDDGVNGSFSIFDSADAILLDYYVEKDSGAQQIDITPDQFGGNYYLEASTLFKDTDGQDLPAEFIIPNCKIQSNFTFTMASSGDPSSFTFTMDAFPDYTRWDKTKKVLASLQVISEDANADDNVRTRTPFQSSGSN